MRRWRCQCMGSVQAICPEAPEHCREQGTYVHVDHGVLRPTRVVCRTLFKLVYSRLVRAEDCPNERCHLPLKRHGLVLGHPHFKGMWHTNTITLVCGFARRSRGRSGSRGMLHHHQFARRRRGCVSIHRKSTRVGRLPVRYCSLQLCGTVISIQVSHDQS